MPEHTYENSLEYKGEHGQPISCSEESHDDSMLLQVVRCFSTDARRQLMYPRPPISVVTVRGASSFLRALETLTGCASCGPAAGLLCEALRAGLWGVAGKEFEFS
ncbi:hypothetical protein TCAL_17078 [Tigriopus californicus]|uniref:Uncharacterized protein n=1 Tax=Tigriopus californicus TaxID=6832 RepID=A0A553PQB0_TIGCA|nr:hypothetical protein TCAL_17078 [Tigriopus californicus]